MCLALLPVKSTVVRQQYAVNMCVTFRRAHSQLLPLPCRSMAAAFLVHQHLGPQVLADSLLVEPSPEIKVL